MPAYYNEIDPYCAQWLRNLIAAGHIPPGDVDERDIREVAADDLEGYTQHHFFAGIGGWPLALRLAGWPDDRPVWTGSCPCQPFSAAGKQGGTDDERHLWPEWFRLVGECRPDTIFGEQVEGSVGFGWIDRVFADLEAEDYACGAAVLGAHSVGAPHIRQRLWWVADANGNRSRPRRGNDGEERSLPQTERQPEHGAALSGRGGTDGGLADTDDGGQQRVISEDEGALWRQGGTDRCRQGLGDTADERRRRLEVSKGSASSREAGGYPVRASDVGGLGDTSDKGLERLWRYGEGSETHGTGCNAAPTSSRSDFWAAHDLIPCADGKSRRVEPGILPLAHGVSARVGKLRAAGNAIVPQVAAAFVMAWMEKSGD